MLYLDAAFQTPLSLPVRTALDAFYDQSVESAGPKHIWLARAEEVRRRLALFIGATPEQVAFTKNTSEGLNICANGLRWERGDNVLIPESEHPNNAYAWLVKRSEGLDVRLIPPDKNWFDADSFSPYIDARTRVIAVSHVMFHNGQRNDIPSIAKLAAARGVEVVVDAMQSIGALAVDVSALGVSAVAAGSHKALLTPHGLGFLYTARNNEQFSPTYVALAGVANGRPDLIAGAEQVELRANAHRFEIGNFNLAAIHALGSALDLVEAVGAANIEEHVLDLGDLLIAYADELGIGLVGPRERKHRSHIYVLNLTDLRWTEFFLEQGARVSRVRDGIRVSFGLYNNSDDVDRFGELLRQGMQVRGFSVN